MQRSISNQKSITPFIYIILFVIYESLSSVYLFLPPLLAVLSVLFIQALKKEDGTEIFMISFCMLVFESQMGYTLFSTIIYFSLIYKFVLPKIEQSISCASCIKISYSILAYIGFFVFSMIMSNIFLLPEPSINYYVIYYIVIEFLIVSIFL